MALVVFLRGVNVGGHRTFRPTALAGKLRDFDVVNVGAAGTFVVKKPGSRTKFLAALRKQLPFDADVAICEGRDLVRLVTRNPFGAAPPGPGVVRFVSVLLTSARARPPIPIVLPPPGGGRWLVRVIGVRKPFVFGMYRRHMKTIGYLGQLDRLLGGRATTRNWNTIAAVVRILKASA